MITMQTPPKLSRTRKGSEALQKQAELVLNVEVGFVSNRDFSDLGDPMKWDMSEIRSWRNMFEAASKSKVAEETEISRLCETGLLSAEQEVVLFRTMNQLKYGANVLRTRLNPKRPSGATMNSITELLKEAEEIRNHIVSANVRLVIAIVKRLTGPQHHFDEFVSDGTLSLMQVVEKFDFDRGFRFSTYAYRAITRTVYRKMANLHKQESRVMTTSDDMLMDVPNRHELSLSEQTWSNLRGLLSQFLDKLDAREQMIIHARYALGDTNKSQTFQSLADSLGVSKERVRQLERRAVKKLQSLASRIDLDCFVEAAIA